jgi:hypothetical protein
MIMIEAASLTHSRKNSAPKRNATENREIK